MEMDGGSGMGGRAYGGSKTLGILTDAPVRAGKRRAARKSASTGL